MPIIRILLVILGFLLLRRLLAGPARGKRRERADVGKQAATAPPFSDAGIQDGEFEEVQERRDASGAAR
ncbi:hypothetical protein FJ251_09255 [bacterium]|nr:hypothetical protein [bacterium]